MDIKPVLWVDDDLDIHFGATHPEMTGNNWKPHYPESAITKAREEGRREGMLEARQLCDLAEIQSDQTQREVRGGEQLVAAGAAKQAKKLSEAITRAAEGK